MTDEAVLSTWSAPRFPSWKGMACSDDRALLVGSTIVEAPKESPELYLTNGVAVLLLPDSTNGRAISVGPGSPEALSAVDRDTVYLAQVERFVDGSHHGTVLRSIDYGRTWSHVAAAPPDIMGLAFDTPAHGFGWSNDNIYETSDGGGTWSVLKLADLRIDTGQPRPVLDAEGSLWVVSHGLSWKPNANALIRVRSGLKAEVMQSEVPFRIVGLAATEAGIFAISSDYWGRNHDLIRYRLDGNKVTMKYVHGFGVPRPEFLASQGAVLAVGLGTMVDGRPRDDLLTSTDGGVTWTARGLPTTRVEAYCLSANRLWVAANAGPV